MASTSIIEITTRVNDQTSSGVSSAINNISRLESSVTRMQTQVSRLQSGQITLSAFLKDSASTGLRSLSSLADKMMGKAVSITMKAIDYATAPIKALINLAKNPITMLVTATGVGFGLSDIISTTSSFEQSMANTRAVTGASDEEMTMISEKSRELGASTAYSASQVGDATTILGTAGWSAEDIVGGVGGLLDLASASNVSIDTAADIVSSTIAQWGMDASESDKVADILAAASSSSKTDVSGIGETFKYAGSIAGGSLGLSLEDIAVATGLMGNMGTDASMAGTALRTMMTTLVSPTDEAADAMNKLGISLTDQTGEIKPFMEIMEDMRTGFSDLTDAEKTFYAEAIAGTTGMTGLSAIVNATEEDFSALTESVYESAGAASEMAAIRMDTLQGDWAAFNSAVEEVKISIGERLTPTLRSLVQWLTAKMPDVAEMFQRAFDWGELKIEDLKFTVTAMMETEEWQEADLVQKMKIAFDTLVGDPFGEWWESTGRSSVTDVANKAGTMLGSVLSGGIITLLGGSVDATSEGVAIGASFAQGFLDGFDVSGVASAIISGLGSIAQEAAKIMPGGEEATAASWLAAGATAVVGSKAISMGQNAVSTVQTGVETARTVGTAVQTATAGQSFLSLAGSAVSTMVQKVAPVTAFFDGISGAMSAESWTGSNSVGNTIASTGAAVIGGTGDGVDFSNLSWSDVIDVGMNTAKGVGLGLLTGTGAVGGLVGGGTALVGSLFGGESIAQFATGYDGEEDSVIKELLSTGELEKYSSSGQNISEQMEQLTQIQESVGESIQDLESTTDSVGSALLDLVMEDFEGASESIASEMESFLGDTLPECMENLVSTAEESLLEQGEVSSEAMVQSLTDFFSVTIPEFMESLWDTTEETLLEQGEVTTEVMTEGITEFFGVTIPEFMSSLWENTGELLTEQGEITSDLMNESVVNFFGVTLPECLSGLWESTETALLEQSEVAFSLIEERMYACVGEFIPESLDIMWTNTETTITETSASAQQIINSGVVEFYGVFIPTSIQRIWDSAKTTINSASATASATVNSSATSFFTSASSSVSSFFSQAQSQINSAMASASSAISSLSVSTGSSSSGTSSGTSAEALANGGILSSPTFALMGEAGPEAVIPLSGNRRSRGIELWEQAGEMLGVKPYANGGIIGKFGGNSGENSKSSVDTGENSTSLVAVTSMVENQTTTKSSQPVNVTVNNVNLTVNVEGNTDSTSLVEKIKENIGGLTNEIAAQLAESLSTIFENMPLVTEKA